MSEVNHGDRLDRRWFNPHPKGDFGNCRGCGVPLKASQDDGWCANCEPRCKQCDGPHDRWDLEYCPACIEARMGSFERQQAAS